MKRYSKPKISVTMITGSALLVSGTTMRVTVNHHPTNGIKGV